MLKSEFVEINLTSSVIVYYENLGYFIPKIKDNHYRYVVSKDTKILVKVNDLSKGSNINIDIQCDYCGELFKKEYYKYIIQKEKSITPKDCCDNCKQLKTKESVLSKYGVERNTQIPEVKEKMSKARRNDIDKVRKLFLERNLLIDENTFNYINDTSLIYFTCNKHPEEGIQSTYYMILQQGGCGCKKCRYKNITGENCHLWKGGITDISNYLRGKISEWKYDSLTENGFRCILTNVNDSSLVIHHLYSFAEIVKETINNTNIILYPKVSMYTDLELKILEEECLRLHYQKGLGIPLLRCIHDRFHAIMGDLIIDNGEFLEFSKRYQNFEFDDLLEEKFKYKNIILKEVG